MVLSKTAEKQRPKKPMGSYFTFRNEALKKMDQNDKNKSKKAKILWDELKESQKEKYYIQSAKEFEKYK